MSVISFLNESELICLHTSIAFVSMQLNGFNYCRLTLMILFDFNLVCWHLLQVLLFNSNYSISTRFIRFHTINGSKYYYVIPLIQFWHTVKEFQVLLFNPSYSIQHYSLVSAHLNNFKYCYVSRTFQLNSHFWTQLNNQIVLFLTIQFSIKSSIWPRERTLPRITTLCQKGPGSERNERLFHILQRSCITRVSPSVLFRVISRTLVVFLGGGLHLCRDAVGVFYCPRRLSYQVSYSGLTFWWMVLPPLQGVQSAFSKPHCNVFKSNAWLFFTVMNILLGQKEQVMLCNDLRLRQADHYQYIWL